MKKRWIFWWIGNIFWIIIFVVGASIIWLRKVDGAGVTQTPELKLVALIVLLIGFILPIIIQVIWLIVSLIISSNK
ncbi:membrane protein [Virgibacillus pantothenticus]|uniref:DUF3923 family protein n=1 Tax=Virgibacillus pantothenticus TaxID=1473 RepID=UPI001B2B595D|nr:DUF3923 family protein [Virgibacillus pantothenticus]MBU8564884.1 DUF3923 family protein [Virgibacillus pantothenticus]MBU8599192.1 DUF3923 family protein [Virgibacillus pantothenticus]MBU8633405.1 DUF3923 family protein [Virgibacillus pantothenticus]MBU8640934.1 DUF3923 family protein [Virgibacillus pantothenticus]MBU8645137.1 DUF3923 family protein [Virgibacillus pantothenticus]